MKWLPAGEYKFEIAARGFKPDSVAPDQDWGVLPEIASFIGDITVPEIGEGEIAKAVDLGTIMLKSPVNH